MSDIYIECLVQARKSRAMKALQICLVVTTVFSLFWAMLLWPFLILTVAAGVGAYFLGLYSDVEYEYCYMDKELTVDRILSKSKRKNVATFDMNRMEIFAPADSWHLDEYKRRTATEVDYSGETEASDICYVMFYDGNKKVYLTPNEELIKALKNIAPRKVFTE